MTISRRALCIGGISSVVLPFAGPAGAAGPLRFLPSPTPTRTPTPTPTPSPTPTPTPSATVDGSYGVYASTLANGYTPQFVTRFGRLATAAMGSTWAAGMDHCWRVTATKDRFELRNTIQDRPAKDPSDKRRSELHFARTADKFARGKIIWGAYSFLDHPWSDPRGMATKQGGLHAQMHMPDGGSPAFAFRRRGNGDFMVTTNGANDPVKNNARVIVPVAAVPFGRVHDIVYRCVIDPVYGQLDVWLDGRQILSLRNASIGLYLDGYKWCIGLYYGGGITCPIISEYGNHAFPMAGVDLSPRTGRAPAW